MLEALRLSLGCASVATVVCLLLGVPLAWLLARVDFPGQRLIRALVTVPLVLPPVVGGVALLLVLGRRGLVGQWLEATFGDHAALHHDGSDHRRGVRGDAVPGPQRGGRAARR